MDLIGWCIFLVALLFSIMLHEIGHLVPAKKFGVKVTEYMIGFGPTLWSTPAGRDRVRHQGHPARRLHPDDRDAPARRRRHDAIDEPRSVHAMVNDARQASGSW